MENSHIPTWQDDYRPRIRARRGGLLTLLLLIMAAVVPLGATLVPKISLERMAADAEMMVHGIVIRKWSGWDDSRQFIWTHYEIEVAEMLRGPSQSKVVVSEPGGMVDGMGMHIAGAPQYEVGDEVILLTYRTPIGYLRTSGWGQGKFTVSRTQGEATVRAASLGVQLVEPAGGKAAAAPFRFTAPGSLDNLTLDECKSRLRRLAGTSSEGRTR